ncbi:SAM-dependent methyltransferase [Gigaspora margarita]|uniref:SAM-dependent methyltransferase n=1 Tax=Gigaspora margarita TaxID=4874 RepID=A0A8H4B014_GIGMA|nr:SAM-dependent methyltransferase [Gigaspora margarita]
MELAMTPNTITSSSINSDIENHWETVYQKNAPDAVSWYCPHLETSLRFIEQATQGQDLSIIDVGGGQSTLVDDLLARGYQNVSVLDISKTAINRTQGRLSEAASKVKWFVADITQVILPENYYDIWHDRAVFHFLTTPEERAAYVKQVNLVTKLGGHVILSTFGLQGPEKCSGLEVVRYDVESLCEQFGEQFQLIESVTEIHQTPFGTTQQFLYCHFKVSLSPHSLFCTNIISQ